MNIHKKWVNKLEGQKKKLDNPETQTLLDTRYSTKINRTAQHRMLKFSHTDPTINPGWTLWQVLANDKQFPNPVTGAR